MSKFNTYASAIRTTVLLSAVVVTLGGFSTTVQASPAAVQLGHPDAAEAIQYYEDDYYPLNDVHGENFHPNHPGVAGLYDCGPGGKNTRLSRKACGGNDRFQHLNDQY